MLLTLQGGYRACSRLGIDSNTSPFLKISFETATAFLTEATLRGAHDDLSSPAARLVLGRVVESGTGVHTTSIWMQHSASAGHERDDCMKSLDAQRLTKIVLTLALMGAGGFGLVQQLPSVPEQHSADVPHDARAQAIAV